MIVEHRFAHIPQDEHRGRAWIASHAPLVEVRLAATATVSLDAFHRYHHLGDVILAVFEAPAQTTERPESLAARQAIDHVVLRTHARGRSRVTVEGRAVETGPGDILVLDLAMPVRIESDPMAGVDLVLPRRVLEDGSGRIPVRHGRKFEAGGAPLIRLVADHLRNLAVCLTVPDPRRDPYLVPATVDLCRALLAITAERDGEAAPDPVRIAMRRFIEENLATVGVAVLMERFGLSRTALYDRFGGGDGVATYIRDRRLAAAMRRLAGAGQRTKLARLAHECGFANPRAFSRAFHRKYGLWPSEAWASGDHCGGTAHETAPMVWLRDL